MASQLCCLLNNKIQSIFSNKLYFLFLLKLPYTQILYPKIILIANDYLDWKIIPLRKLSPEPCSNAQALWSILEQCHKAQVESYKYAIVTLAIILHSSSQHLFSICIVSWRWPKVDNMNEEEKVILNKGKELNGCPIDVGAMTSFQ